MSEVSRQDVQVIADVCRNRIMERMATKHDMTITLELAKSTLSVSQQNQQLLRQSEHQRSQLEKRVVSLEARLMDLKNEIRLLTYAVNQAAGQHVQQPTAASPQTKRGGDAAQQPTPQYAYYYQA